MIDENTSEVKSADDENPANIPDPQANGHPTGGNGELPPEVANYSWPEGCTRVMARDSRKKLQYFGYTLEPDQKEPLVTLIHPEPREERIDRRFLRDFDGRLWPLRDGELPWDVENHDWPEGRVRVRFGRHDANTGKTEYFYGYILNDHPEEPFVRIIYPCSSWYGFLPRSRLCHIDEQPLPPYEAPPKKKRRKEKEDTEPKSAAPKSAMFDQPILSNYNQESGIPASMREIFDQLQELSPGWPKRLGEVLFVESDDHRPIFLEDVNALVQWISGKAMVDFIEKHGYFTMGHFFSYLSKTAAERFDAIEKLPHYPEVKGTYYMHRPIEKRRGLKLVNKFLNFFRPFQAEDRELMRALLFTLFWGGPGGKRPFFLIAGPDNDPKQGRYTGKTTLSRKMSKPAGGYITFDHQKERVGDLKSRILSSEHIATRVIEMDNVKALVYSNADVESFITQEMISGRKNYCGEFQILNLKTWVMTMNGGSLSVDMATRAVPIKVARPKQDPKWDDKVDTFLLEHGWEMIEEIVAELERISKTETNGKPDTRWGGWYRQVLAGCKDPTGLMKLISKRIEELDADTGQGEDFEGFIRRKLAGNHKPDVENIRISSTWMAGLVSEFTERKVAANKVTAIIKATYQNLTHLEWDKDRDGSYFTWWADPKNKKGNIIMYLDYSPGYAVDKGHS
jgi:hypothetical protein